MTIYYKDDNVEIVSPDTVGSIPIFHQVGYTRTAEPTRFVDICREGLKSYNEIRKSDPSMNERKNKRWQINNKHNDYIFLERLNSDRMMIVGDIWDLKNYSKNYMAKHERCYLNIM